MAALAEATGSVISAVLFGALAGSGALPFQRAAFEAAIRRGGVGVAGEPRGVRGRLRGAQRQAATPPPQSTRRAKPR